MGDTRFINLDSKIYLYSGMYPRQRVHTAFGSNDRFINLDQGLHVKALTNHIKNYSTNWVLNIWFEETIIPIPESKGVKIESQPYLLRINNNLNDFDLF